MQLDRDSFCTCMHIYTQNINYTHVFVGRLVTCITCLHSWIHIALGDWIGWTSDENSTNRFFAEVRSLTEKSSAEVLMVVGWGSSLHTRTHTRLDKHSHATIYHLKVFYLERWGIIIFHGYVTVNCTEFFLSGKLPFRASGSGILLNTRYIEASNVFFSTKLGANMPIGNASIHSYRVPSEVSVRSHRRFATKTQVGCSRCFQFSCGNF